MESSWSKRRTSFLALDLGILAHAPVSRFVQAQRTKVAHRITRSRFTRTTVVSSSASFWSVTATSSPIGPVSHSRARSIECTAWPFTATIASPVSIPARLGFAIGGDHDRDNGLCAGPSPFPKREGNATSARGLARRALPFAQNDLDAVGGAPTRISMGSARASAQLGRIGFERHLPLWKSGEPEVTVSAGTNDVGGQRSHREICGRYVLRHARSCYRVAL